MRIMGEGEDDKSGTNRNKKFLIVNQNSAIFKLPNDWVVKKRRRIHSTVHPGRVDKYYHDPRTGQQFRSLLSVQKYLNYDMRDALKLETMNRGNQSNMQIVPHTFRGTTPFKLPNNWVIEEKPRTNVNYPGVVDRYYIKPGTGQRFRSLIAAERYLTGMDEESTTLKELKTACQKKNHSDDNRSLQIILRRSTNATGIRTTAKALEFDSESMISKRSGSRTTQRYIEDEKILMLDFTRPPAKVKWVLSGPGGNMWNAFMGESLVPEYVKQKWSETFVISIQD
ncbi:MBD domain-containing protein [Cephalotus follicularis]|uniref:MBD domain-containing protein n=1 Tax=Cephalotus follicularis TaxID=3775 RepID=A0A1Q3AQQ1_CEPFO|nr:MBD domain-containing protein [Cephalotus follicularis]